jgi:endoglucanase
MQFSFLLLAALARFGFSLSCKGFVTQHGRLSINDNQLIDSYGERVQLRGLSSSGFAASTYRYSCVSKESLSYAVLNYGVNIFRLPILISAAENGYETNSAYYDSYIDDVVTWCEDLGIYVIIDWHVTSPGDPNYWLDSPGASTGLAVSFWKKMAMSYGTKSHVIYEIANEPNNVTWAEVLLYHNSIIQEIRQLDPLNLIIAGTTHWSQDLDLPIIDPVLQPANVMYAFHFYASSHGYLYNYTAEYIDRLPVFVTWSVSESTGSGVVNFTVSNQYLQLFAGEETSGSSTLTSWVMSAMSDSAQSSSTLQPTSCTQKKWTSLTETGSFINNYLLNTSYFIEQDLPWCNPAPTGQPTGQPSSTPTISHQPTGEPTSQPTEVPTGQPTEQPTGDPTGQPTSSPTSAPTIFPTVYVRVSSTTFSLSTEALVGITLGGVAVLLIVFLFIGWMIQGNKKKRMPQTNHTHSSSPDHQYHNPEGVGGGEEGGIAMTEAIDTSQPEDLEAMNLRVEEPPDDDGGQYLSTAAIYHQDENSTIVSHDTTIPASHHHRENRGRETTTSRRATKRLSHSPPPSNPLHQNHPKRQSRSKTPPVPQGSKKKRNSSSRTPSPRHAR